MWLKPANFLYIHFYCKGPELNKYLKQKNKKLKNGKLSKLEQRKNVFEQYLRGIAVENSIDTSDIKKAYQNAYVASGSPSQKAILAILQSRDPELFEGLQANFFRDQTVIMFKIGPGSRS
jgi:hypothetical protein